MKRNTVCGVLKIGTFSHMSALLFMLAVGISGGMSTSSTQAQSLLMPGYKYPTTWTQDTYWDTVVQAGGQSIPFVIMNPASGPGATVNSDYTQQISANRAAGIKNIGYVNVEYQNRPLSEVKQALDDWHAFYPNIEGIMLDEVDANSLGGVCYMSQVHNYIKAKWPSDTVMANPGVAMHDVYAPYADIFITFEGTADTYINSFAARTSEFETNSAHAGRIMHIVHGVGAGDYALIVDKLRDRGAGWGYITDDTLPNPYDTLPSNFSELVADFSIDPVSLPPIRPSQFPIDNCEDPYARTTAAGGVVSSPQAGSGGESGERMVKEPLRRTSEMRNAELLSAPNTGMGAATGRGWRYWLAASGVILLFLSVYVWQASKKRISFSRSE